MGSIVGTYLKIATGSDRQLRWCFGNQPRSRTADLSPALARQSIDQSQFNFIFHIAARGQAGHLIGDSAVETRPKTRIGAGHFLKMAYCQTTLGEAAISMKIRAQLTVPSSSGLSQPDSASQGQAWSDAGSSANLSALSCLSHLGTCSTTELY